MAIEFTSYVDYWLDYPLEGVPGVGIRDIVREDSWIPVH